MQAWLAAHAVDIIIAITLAWYGTEGYLQGFLSMGVETIGFLLALLAATLGYHPLGTFLAARFVMPQAFANAIAFFGLWWLIDLAWRLASRPFYDRLPQKWRWSGINRAFGVVPGALNGALVLSVILTVVSALPFSRPIKTMAIGPTLAKPLLAFTSGVDQLIAPVLGPLAEQGFNLLTVHPESEESIDLHFTYHDGKTDAADEQAMVKLVNDERVKRGLRPLAVSTALTAVARAHAQDMFERGYFSHVAPEGLTPADRLDQAGISYGVMGENQALAPDLSVAHAGLMNSPGHRANILGASFRKIGIGVIDGGVYGEMFVQEFTD